MNITDFRKEGRRKNHSRRIADRRQNTKPFGSGGGEESVKNTDSYIPRFDRRLSSRRCADRRQLDRRQNRSFETKYAQQGTIRLILTAEERQLIEDLYFLDSLE